MLAQLFERRFRAVARIGKDLPGGGPGVARYRRQNDRQLAAVGSTVTQFGRDDDVGRVVDSSLGIVGIVEAAAGMLHDPAFRVGKALLGVGLGLAEFVLEARLLFRLVAAIRRRVVLPSPHPGTSPGAGPFP